MFKKLDELNLKRLEELDLKRINELNLKRLDKIPEADKAYIAEVLEHRVLPFIKHNKDRPQLIKDFCASNPSARTSPHASDRARYYAYSIGYQMYVKGLIEFS